MKNFLKYMLVTGVGFNLLAFANLSYADSPAKQVAPASQISATINKVVASYDNSLILLSDIRPYLPKNKLTFTDKEFKDAIDAYVVRQLKSKWETKAKQSVRVTDAEVTDELFNIAARNGLTYSNFVVELQRQGMSLDRFKAQLKQSIYQAKLANFLKDNVSAQLDNDKIQREGYELYRKAVDTNTLAKTQTYKVSYILLKVTPIETEQKVKSKLIKIKKEIDSKQISFGEAAYKYSEDLISAANYGPVGLTIDLPERQRFLIENQIKNLKPGQITKPFPIPQLGWVIVRYDAKETAEAGYEYYVNQVYNKELQARYSTNTLEQFLLNSVVINYLYKNSN